MARPILDDVELQQVQNIEVDQDQELAQHGVPALEGDFLQDLGRSASRVALTGVLSRAESAEGLKTLRDKFRAAEPVSFVTDITTATRVDQVLIEELGVRELAGKPERFEYALALREFIPPPEPPEEPPPIIPPDPVQTATLIVEVIVEGDPAFDFSNTTVTVEGKQADGATLSRTLTNRTGGVWTENDFPPGQYTARAAVADPPPMTGSTSAVVRDGQTTRVTIRLRPENAETIATTFIIHFWFDKAFIEPCLRPVMRQVAEFAKNQSAQKLLIVGHTDLVGDDDYNQALSERRARSAFAYLTFGLDPDAAVAEWDRLRRTRGGGAQGLLNDNWGAREYQYILQDLGFHRGNITEVHDDATDKAVRDFQAAQGLVVDGIVGDDTWLALIRTYLGQDALAVPPDKFLRNARDGCDGGILKWLGCGEQDPVRNTQDAWRPNRRTEFLFVRVEALPCNVPKPVTFDLPAPNVVGTTWCLGGSPVGARNCFAVPAQAEECPPDDPRLCRKPFDPKKIKVQGSIKFEDGTPLANADFVLTAPDGEYLHTDETGEQDLGERPSGSQRGRPIPDRTDENGAFSYPRETPVGIYSVEVKGPFVARLEGEPPEAAKGNVVCKRLDGDSTINIIVTPRAASLEFVAPDDADTLVASARVGDTMRVRADIPGISGDEVVVQIIGADATPVAITPPPPPTTPALEFVAADNADNPAPNVREGGNMRLRADVSGVTGDEITVDIFGVDAIRP